MADYLHILSRKKKFLQLLDEQIRDAEENRQKEINAATSIQRVYRGSVCRYDITKKNYAVNEIQRCFRGHMGRKKAKNESNDKQTQRQLHYIHYLCIQIQRCFRGFYSRKYKRDHARRKAYCRMIEEKGKEILNNMQQYVFEQTEREAEEAKIKRENEFKDLAKNLHHLLSTRQIRGVYNPLTHLVMQPTMNQQPVEQHIRGVVKDLLRTRGITKRGLVADINGTLKIPYNGQKYRLSLQASVPYDTVRKEQLREKLLHTILTRDKGSFVAGGKTKLLDKNGVPLTVGDPYMDPWANPMLVKGVPADQKELLESAHTRKALFATAPTKPFVSRVGGNRSTTLPNDVFDVIAEAEETGGAIHRNLGTATTRFGLASTMDSRSATIEPNFTLATTNVPDGYRNPVDPLRGSSTLRSTQKRVKTYSALKNRSRPPSTLKTTGHIAISQNKVPFDRISEVLNEDSSVLTMGSKSYDFSQTKQVYHNNNNHAVDDSSEEEDDFRG